jgi:mRNA-degrading endonuclease RelE of RelBE toxin-antitoxin system
MNIFIFSKKAEKDFLKLEKNDQKRILEKLKELKSHLNLISVLKKVLDLELATHRLRI